MQNIITKPSTWLKTSFALITALLLSTSSLAMSIETVCQQELTDFEWKPGFYLGIPVATIEKNIHFGQRKFKHTALFVDHENFNDASLEKEKIRGVSGVLQNLNHAINVDSKLRRAFGPPSEATWGWYWSGLAEIRRFDTALIVSLNCEAFDQGL